MSTRRSRGRSGAVRKPRATTAAKLLPYVECDPRGARAQPEACERMGVRVYPTWRTAGRRHEGARSLNRLAQLSGFPS